MIIPSNTIGEDEIDGHHVYKVEMTPVNDETAEELGYGRAIAFIDSEIWIPRKTEIWDTGGNSLKTVHTPKIEQIDGIWTAVVIEIENHKTGQRSIFTFSEIDYEAPVDDSAFSERALRRGGR